MIYSFITEQAVTSVVYVHKDASIVRCTAVIAKTLLQELPDTEGSGHKRFLVVIFWSMSCGREHTTVGVM